MGVTGTGVSVRVECNSVSKKEDRLQLYRGYVPSLAPGAHDDCTSHETRPEVHVEHSHGALSAAGTA